MQQFEEESEEESDHCVNLITAPKQAKKQGPSGFDPPKAPELKNPMSDLGQSPINNQSSFMSPIKPVRQKGRVPSNNKTQETLDFTIDKNPEFNMHNPKFAETSPTLPTNEKIPNMFDDEVQKPKVKSKKPKPPAESDDELAFLGKPPVESEEEEEVKSPEPPHRKSVKFLSESLS